MHGFVLLVYLYNGDNVLICDICSSYFLKFLCDLVSLYGVIYARMPKMDNVGLLCIYGRDWENKVVASNKFI